MATVDYIFEGRKFLTRGKFESTKAGRIGESHRAGERAAWNEVF